MPRKTKTVHNPDALKGAPDPDNLEFVMWSSEKPDRVGDLIKLSGIKLSDFKKNPIALWAHQSRFPIGKWVDVRVEGEKLIGVLKLAAPGTSRLIDELRALIMQGILKAVSIGFSIDFDKMEPNEHGGFTFSKVELLECSLVAVPANQAALLRGKGMKISDEAMDEFFLDPDEPGSPDTVPARAHTTRQSSSITKTGKPLATPKPSTPVRKERPMNIAERIAAKNERLIAIKDRLTELKSVLEADDEAELSEDEQSELEALEAEQESISKAISSLKKIEAGLAAKATAVDVTADPNGSTALRGHRVAAAPKKKEPGGSLMVKSMAVQLIAKMTDRPHAEVMSEMYGDDDRVKAVSKVFSANRRKAAVELGDTTTPGWAAELVQDDLRGFLDDLANVSVYASLLQQTGALSLDFGGSGTVTIPRRDKTNQSTGAAAGLSAAGNLGSQMGGSWVGENGVIPVKSMALGSQTLARYKVAVISGFTNELLEQSTPSIEALIRRAILEDTAMAIDGSLLDAVGAVAGIRPASIFNGAATQASAGNTAADIITDIKYLLALMSAINGANPVLLMNSNRLLGLSTITTAAGGFMFRDEIRSGQLLGVPVISSTNIAANAVGIVDAGSFVGANDVPQFAISDQATLTMANADATAPSQAGDATDHTGGDLGTPEQVPADGGIIVAGDTTGAPAGTSVAGYQAQSLWQSYSQAIRMVLPSSWGLVRPGATAYLTGVNW